MASTRSTAQRRRAQAMARQSQYSRPATNGVNPSITPNPAVPDERLDRRVPRWPWAIGLILCFLGLADAAYLTYAHYTTAASLACSDKGIINCAKVTTSSYSHLFGLPVAVLGLVFFAGMFPLMLPAAWRSTWPLLRVGRVAATVVGIGMVLYLVYAEVVKLDAICLYCSVVHLLTFALFIVVALGTIATSRDPV